LEALLVAAVSAVVTVLLYLPFLHSFFLWDDVGVMVQPTGASGWLRPFQPLDNGFLRILIFSSQGSLYEVFGTQCTGYHFAAITLHVVAANRWVKGGLQFK